MTLRVQFFVIVIFIVYVVPTVCAASRENPCSVPPELRAWIAYCCMYSCKSPTQALRQIGRLRLVCKGFNCLFGGVDWVNIKKAYELVKALESQTDISLTLSILESQEILSVYKSLQGLSEPMALCFRLLLANTLKQLSSFIKNDFLSRAQSPLAIEALLQAGASPRGFSSQGVMVLHAAVASGDVMKVARLLQVGGRGLLAYRTFTTSPLHKAVSQGNYPMVKMLVENGADVNCVTIQGQTPLHCSQIVRDREIIKLLIQHGAKVSKIDIYGNTPFSWKDICDDAEMTNLIKENDSEFNAYHDLLGDSLRR